MVNLRLQTIELADANNFVALHHRHSDPVRGHKFSISALSGGDVVGVAIVGRPVARGLQNGVTLEVLRCCTDGTRNACSFLYGAAWRAAKALGYARMFTYTRADETGASLRAAGWIEDAHVAGRHWSCPSRPRKANEIIDKIRWKVAT